MDKLVWFVDARFNITDCIVGKIIRLAGVFEAHVNVVIDKRIRALERWSPFDWFDNEEVIDTHKTQIEQLSSYIARELSDHSIGYSITEIADADYLSILNGLLEPHTSSIFVIDDEARQHKHPILQQLGTIKSPMLLLTKKNWKNEMSILAGVDPLHENARPQQLDKSIVNITRRWSNMLRASWRVAHCCFVPPLVLKYKKNIIDIHEQGLDDFTKTSQIPSHHSMLLHGNPEHALPQFVTTHAIDLLVLGSVARNAFEQIYIGSTTSVLLDHPPCDMLLVNT